LVGVVAVLLVSGAALAQTPTPTEIAEWRVDADAGDANAHYNLGVIYSNGQGVPQDFAQGVTWYRQAAEQGLANAQANLGSMYGTGQGVPEDIVEAHKWVNLAASRASAENQTRFAEARDELPKQMAMTPA
jgi:TPR repeat protein